SQMMQAVALLLLVSALVGLRLFPGPTPASRPRQRARESHVQRTAGLPAPLSACDQATALSRLAHPGGTCAGAAAILSGAFGSAHALNLPQRGARRLTSGRA